MECTFCHKEYLPDGNYRFCSETCRFESKIRMTDTCWLWQGALNKQGYGVFCTNENKTELVHRYAYKMYKGNIPLQTCVLHRCNEFSCVNPEHLFVNDTPWKSKLSKENVLEIKQLLKQKYTYKEIAAMYGVSASTIGGISRSISWKIIEGT